MKASELIELLAHYINKYGDKEVIYEEGCQELPIFLVGWDSFRSKIVLK